MAQIVTVQSGQSQVRLPTRVVYTANDKVLLSDSDFDSLSSSAFTATLTDSGPGILTAVVSLSSITTNNQTVATFTPGFAGSIRHISAIVTTAATTAARLATVGVFIDQDGAGSSFADVECNGGRLALTSANATPISKVLGGTNVTFSSANPNTFTSSSQVKIKTVAAPTAFAEGAVAFLVFVEPSGQVLTIK